MPFIAHQLLLNPGFWIFCVLIGGIVLNYKKRLWLAIPLSILAILLIPKPIQYLVAKEERKFPTWEFQKREAPYILVLGAGGTPEPELSPMHRISGSPYHRVMQGIHVWQQVPKALLVFSSAGREGYPSQAEMYAEVAREWGVPDSVIRIVPTPKTTREEARDFKAAFPDAESLILVTSAMHIPRAMKIFEKQGLEVIPAPSDFRVKRHPDGERFGWIPSLEAMLMWQGYLHEKAGMVMLGL